MDPKETYQKMNSAITRHDGWSAYECASKLLEWLGCGGEPPIGIPGAIVAHECRRTLRIYAAYAC